MKSCFGFLVGLFVLFTVVVSVLHGLGYIGEFPTLDNFVSKRECVATYDPTIKQGTMNIYSIGMTAAYLALLFVSGGARSIHRAYAVNAVFHVPFYIYMAVIIFGSQFNACAQNAWMPRFFVGAWMMMLVSTIAFLFVGIAKYIENNKLYSSINDHPPLLVFTFANGLLIVGLMLMNFVSAIETGYNDDRFIVNMPSALSVLLVLLGCGSSFFWNLQYMGKIAEYAGRENKIETSMFRKLEDAKMNYSRHQSHNAANLTNRQISSTKDAPELPTPPAYPQKVGTRYTR